jgi:uncharacterized protein YndB with AHSA1/START domain
MDTVTGAHVAIARTVPVPRDRMWDLITAVDRIGEWSPETVGGAWFDGAEGPYRGARFIGRNRFADGFLATVTCVVIEAERPSTFAWTVLDDEGQVGSTWRYDLADGPEPGTTAVYQSFTHGPGKTGARSGEAVDPGSLDRRLATLCGYMTTTIAAMVNSENSIGAVR